MLVWLTILLMLSQVVVVVVVVLILYHLDTATKEWINFDF